MAINPFTWNYQAWRCFFVLAALWNFLGFFSVFWPYKSFQDLFGEDPKDDITILLYRLLWLLVVLFGVSYIIIAYDPKSFPGLLLLGIIAKVLAAGTFIIYHVKGFLQKGILVGVVGDLLFSLFFALYLIGGAQSPIL